MWNVLGLDIASLFLPMHSEMNCHIACLHDTSRHLYSVCRTFSQ